jgi:hypothetical protein
MEEEEVVGAADVMELILPRNREALLPIQLPHAEMAAEARAAVASPFDAVVTFVAVVFVEETDATEAKLSGRSFLSPVPVEASTEGEKDDGGAGFGEPKSEVDGFGETLLLLLALGLVNGLLKEGRLTPAFGR